MSILYNPSKRGPSPLRFEKMWIQHKDFCSNDANRWKDFEFEGWVLREVMVSSKAETHQRKDNIKYLDIWGKKN